MARSTTPCDVLMRGFAKLLFSDVEVLTFTDSPDPVPGKIRGFKDGPGLLVGGFVTGHVGNGEAHFHVILTVDGKPVVETPRYFDGVVKTVTLPVVYFNRLEIEVTNTSTRLLAFWKPLPNAL